MYLLNACNSLGAHLHAQGGARDTARGPARTWARQQPGRRAGQRWAGRRGRAGRWRSARCAHAVVVRATLRRTLRQRRAAARLRALLPLRERGDGGTHALLAGPLGEGQGRVAARRQPRGREEVFILFFSVTLTCFSLIQFEPITVSTNCLLPM
ncbi:hypothetical protein T492DRAFT_974029 [Pavlovales sp. CCMP2436]|nr:hypothetical protein T492DRAFT_974029 [Pavlovales sp. CCMP2436]